VADAVRGGKVRALVAAADGAPGGRRQLQARGRQLPLVGVLTAEELGAAFGRDRVVNAAMGPGPLCRRLLSDAQKLAGFRAGAVVEPAKNSVPAAASRRGEGIGAK
jgi:hypothetical protein